MYEYLSGNFTGLFPTHVIVDVHGVGYFLHISLHTYAQIKGKTNGRLFVSFQVREDAHTLYGFSSEEERRLFEHLISVSGIGPNTGRMILSSLSPDEVHAAIITGNVSLLKSIKGIGPKTAQRMILELQDKLKKPGVVSDTGLSGNVGINVALEEASSALVLLGFGKAQVEKCLGNIAKTTPEMSVEAMIKEALKRL